MGLLYDTQLFSGHGGAVYSVEFDPTGMHLASASFDKTILLWDVFKESDANYHILQVCVVSISDNILSPWQQQLKNTYLL